jgi:hypothetical protein
MNIQYFQTSTVLDADYPIPVTDGTGQRQFRRAYQITGLPAMHIGDVLLITGKTCVVNPSSANIQILDELSLGNTPNWNWDGPTAGPGIIEPPSGMNIGPANHYAVPHLAWQYQILSEQPAGWALEWRLYGQSSAGVGTMCPILQGYGGMQITILRN